MLEALISVNKIYGLITSILNRAILREALACNYKAMTQARYLGQPYLVQSMSELRLSNAHGSAGETGV